VARRFARHALLPAQDEEDCISDRVLDNGIGMGGGMVDVVDRRVEDQMNFEVHVMLEA
jgi:hypothetical protein